MKKVVVSEFFDPVAIEALSRDFVVVSDPSLAEDRDGLSGALAEADAVVVRNRTVVDADLLASAPNLTLVCRLGVGLDNIDVEAVNARGARLVTGAGLNTKAVAEYVIGTALVLRRGFVAASSQTKQGRWPRTDSVGHELNGATIGSLGFGGIAREVASLARGLGMTVLAHDPWIPTSDPAWEQAANCSFEALLEDSDILTIHVPLTPETKGLIGPAELASLPDGAVVINTSRGGIVDEPSLAAGLSAGKLGGAAIDVFETEPISPQTAALFTDMPNVILTPHIAGVTRESQAAITERVVAAIWEHLGPT